MKWLKIILSLAVLALAFCFLDLEGVIDQLTNIRPGAIALCFLFTALTLVVMGYRWHLLITTSLSTSFLFDFVTYFQASFMNSFTPANIGGDIYRTMKYKDKKGYTGVINLLFIERIFGLFSHFSVFAVAYGYLWLTDSRPFIDSHAAKVAVVVAVAVCIVILLLPSCVNAFCSLLPGERLTKVRTFLRAAANYSALGSIGKTLTLLGLSYVVLALWIGATYVLAYSIGSGLNFWQMAAIASMVEIIRLIPVTMQGIGVRESGYAYAFSIMGTSPEQGFLVGTICYGIMSVTTFASGLSMCVPNTTEVSEDQS